MREPTEHDEEGPGARPHTDDRSRSPRRRAAPSDSSQRDAAADARARDGLAPLITNTGDDSDAAPTG